MRTALKLLVVAFLSTGASVCGISTAEARIIGKTGLNSSKTSDSLTARINELEKTIENGSYTRIPNEDFDNIIDAKIQQFVRDTIKWWLFIIAALISLLGFLVNKYARYYLQTTVDEKINLLKKENEEKIRSISNKYFSSVIDSLLDFKTETITKKNFYVLEPVINDLRNYLNDESITITEDKKVFLIDTIMRCYYYSNFPQRIEKMIDLIKDYEEKFILLHTTYANAAIAFSDMYDRYGTKDFLLAAVENCNKSIRILPDYGLAYAQKLELYIMAVTKGYDDAEKKLYENELLKVFKDIGNNRSTILCVELVQRLKVDESSFLAPYISILYKDFADEMAIIEERAKASNPPEKT